MKILSTLILTIGLVLSCVPNASAQQQLKIGLGAPLSGPDSVFGNELRIGVEQAVADINASGGFLGRKASIVTGDDRDDSKKGVEIAKGFVDTGVKLVIGHFSSAVTLPASAIYAQSGILDITPSATAPQVTDRRLPTIFRTCGREDQQAEVMAKFLRGRRYASIAIVHDRTSAGKALADAVRAALAAAGTTNTFYGSFAQDTRDISALVSRVRTAGAQIVVWGGGPAGAALLTRQLRDSNARIPLIGGMSMASDDFPSQAGQTADGTFMVFPQDPRQRSQAAELIRRLQAKNSDLKNSDLKTSDAKNSEAYGYVFYAYAAVQVIHQASQATGSLDPKVLAATLHGGMPFRTVIGTLVFDDKGDPKTSDLTIYVWHKGPSGRMGFVTPANS